MRKITGLWIVLAAGLLGGGNVRGQSLLGSIYPWLVSSRGIQLYDVSGNVTVYSNGLPLGYGQPVSAAGDRGTAPTAVARRWDTAGTGSAPGFRRYIQP